MSRSTIFRRLTPAGRGAVGVTLLSGPDALGLLSRFLTLPSGKRIDPLGDLEPFREKPVFGFFSLGEAAEQVVVHLESPERVEIHAHGGEAVLAAICQTLQAAGAVSPEDLSPGGAADSSTESSQEESFAEIAARLLPAAKTERAAKIVLDQYHGAQDRLFAETEQALTLRRAMPFDAEISRRIEPLLARIDRTIALGRFGRFLLDPPNVVLAGPVNAGKSSLLNALLGFDRVLTDAAAGTTRDAVAAETAFDGFPLRLIDTAGIRASQNEIEREGIRRAKSLLSSADLILAVFDSSGGVEKERAAFCASLAEHKTEKERRTLFVMNKSDLVAERFSSRFSDDSDALSVCAFDAASVERLAERVLAALFPLRPAPGEPVPLSEEETARWQNRRRELTE